MKIRLAILVCAVAVLLSACAYHVVEEAPIQVGSAVMNAADAS